MHLLRIVDLDWGQQTFFCKGPEVNILGFVGRVSLLQLFNSASLAEGKCCGTTESAVYTLFVLTLMTILGDVYDDMPFYR